MSIKSFINNWSKNPYYPIINLNNHKMLNWMPDRTFLRLSYRARMGKSLNLKDPKTFNEKLNFLKLYDRKDIYTQMVDKYGVKSYVADIIGEEYIIPTLGIYESFDEIDFDKLPNQFVLKCTHDSGGLVIVSDKTKLDASKAKEKIEKSLKVNYYWGKREWPYKNVKPRIIAEKYMKDENNDFLPVYKFMCFNGEPRIIQTIQNDKQPNESIDYFDTEWNLLDLRQNYPNSEKPLPRPQKLSDMLGIVKTLANGKNFIRVDLYLVNDAIYFSEFTFYSDAGLTKFEPEEWDERLGGWISLPEC